MVYFVPNVRQWRAPRRQASGSSHSRLRQDQIAIFDYEPTLRSGEGTASFELRHLPVANLGIRHLVGVNPITRTARYVVDQYFQETATQGLRRTVCFGGTRPLQARYIRICIFTHAAMVVARFAPLEDLTTEKPPEFTGM
jgi:hypothetical protein